MNLGDHVGDDLGQVTRNRALLRDAIRASPVFLTQVHGSHVIQLGQQGQQGEHGTEADACITQHPGVACTIMVADCLPVLFANRQGTVVGAAHAGWRGLAGEPARPARPAKPSKAESGVLEMIFQSFRALSSVHIEQLATELIVNKAMGESPGEPLARLSAGHPEAAQPTARQPSAVPDILVWLGPCIGPEKFEVGSEVRNAFLLHDAAAQSMFKPLSPGKWLADLAGLARLRLRAMGIENIYGNDGSQGWCTASNPSRFFSHRRDAMALGGSGRMAACIWLG